MSVGWYHDKVPVDSVSDMRVVQSHDFTKDLLDFCFIPLSGKYDDKNNRCHYQLDAPGVPRLPSPVASGRRVAVAVRAVGEDGEGSGSGGQMSRFISSVFFWYGKNMEKSMNIKKHERRSMKQCGWI